MRLFFTLACLLLISALGYAFSPASPNSPTQQGNGTSTIVVNILTRGAPDVGLKIKDSEPKTRSFKLHCKHCHLTNPQYYVNITVDLVDGQTPLQLAQAFADAIEEAKEGCLGLCDYEVEVMNNSLIITGIGANHYAGTIFQPAYEGEIGDDFYDNGKPKKSPFCRLEIYEHK